MMNHFHVLVCLLYQELLFQSLLYPVRRGFNDVNRSVFIRFQVPLALALARASRALSGYSVPHGIVNDVHDGKFFDGQYVALSRASSAEKFSCSHLCNPLNLQVIRILGLQCMRSIVV
jgi:hypothetical protein